MKISIIGTNGMLSNCLTKCFYNDGHIVDTYGLDIPIGVSYSTFTKLNLLEPLIINEDILKSDIIIYAAGAGVQAAIQTEARSMYALNVNVPIELTLLLKKRSYNGIYISFGSYMEIGLNEDNGKSFLEVDIICSPLPVTNDYALSKRLYSRYINDFQANYNHWHFILPNMFSYDDINPGTRLIPYTLNYLRNYNKGLESERPSFSAGNQIRQFILMEDIFHVILKSIRQNLPAGVYNIGGGELMSIRSLIERLFKSYKVPCDESFFGKEIRRDGDIKCLQIDGAKLKDKIGYLPSKKIEDVFMYQELLNK